MIPLERIGFESMSRGKLGTLFIVFVILLSFLSITSSNRESVAVDKPQKVEVLSEEVNIISNAGFESGGFSPWVNQGGTTYNEIQSSRVYSGTYALYMNSHLSSTPYEPVYQEIDTEIPLFEAQTFSFVVYPTKVGNTAGQAGVDQIWIGVYNRASDTNKNVFYEWSGYTYPGGALGVNVTKVLYLLFDLIPNIWNFVERNLYDDYCAFYGAPENNNDLVVNRITLLSHNSNGDPGDFWIDDVSICYLSEPTTTTSDPTTSTQTDTNTPPTTPQESGSLVTIVIAAGSGAVIIIVVIVILLSRKGGSGAAPVSEYNW